MAMQGIKVEFFDITKKMQHLVFHQNAPGTIKFDITTSSGMHDGKVCIFFLNMVLQGIKIVV